MAWSDAARAAALEARRRGRTQYGQLENFARRQMKLKSAAREHQRIDALMLKDAKKPSAVKAQAQGRRMMRAMKSNILFGFRR